MSFPSIALIVGALFLIVGLAVSLKSPYVEASATGKAARVIATAVGLILIVTSIIAYTGERAPQVTPPATVQDKPGPTAVPSPQPTEGARETDARPTPLTSKADPEKLIEVIKREQENEVKKSYNQYDNFSKVDLATFKKEGRAEGVAKRLEKDGEFIDIVVAVRGLDATARQKLLDRAAGTYKKTWAELHKITPEGQTEAGQKAERMIAEAVVEKVKKLLPKSDAELRALSP